MKHTLFRIVTKATIFATVFLTVLGAITPVAYATAFDSVRMDLSRMQASTATSSTFTIVLPSGVNWDATTASDTITISYPTSSATWSFLTASSWTATDFLIYEGTQQITVAAGAVVTSTAAGTNFSSATVACGAGTSDNNGQVMVNTTDLKLYFRRCGGGGGAAPANAATIYITIKGTQSTITTPTAANNILVSVDLNDENGTSYSDQVATSIIANDATTPSAPAPTTPTMTFVVSQDVMTSNAASACGTSGQSSATTFGFPNPLSVTQVNNATSTICTYVSSTTGSLISVYIYSANGGLSVSGAASTWLNSGAAKYSTAASKTLTVGTSREDGVCVLSNSDTGASDTGGSESDSSPYNGQCNYTSMSQTAETLGTVPKLSDAGLSTLWTATNGGGGVHATHILPRAVITTATTAGTYSDTYYLLASAAF